MWLRAVALALASVPARIMADLGSKSIAAAIFRDEDDQPGEANYALVLVELAIERDMRRLQGPPLIELFGTSHPGT